MSKERLEEENFEVTEEMVKGLFTGSTAEQVDYSNYSGEDEVSDEEMEEDVEEIGVSTPSKLGLRKGALVAQKKGIYSIGRYHKTNDRKFAVSINGAKEDLKKSRRVEILVASSEAADNRNDEERAEQLVDNAFAELKRMHSNAVKKQFVAKKAKTRRNHFNGRIAEEAAFDSEVEATYGQEREEFATLAEKEAHQVRSEAGKRAAVTRKANQAKADVAYEKWYVEEVFASKPKQTDGKSGK